MRTMQKQKGMTLPELVFTVGIVLSLLALSAVAIKKGGLMYKTYSAATQVEAVSQAAMAWAGADAKFTGISMAVLNAASLTSGIGDGVSQNPWNGNITVAVGAQAYQYVISMTAVPLDAGTVMAKKYGAAGTYNSGTKTFSVTLGGS